MPTSLDLGDHDGTHISWTVNVEVGKQVMFSLLDKNDQEAWSGNVSTRSLNAPWGRAFSFPFAIFTTDDRQGGF